MTKEQVGLSLLCTMTLVGACTYMAPAESNSAGSQASSSATSSSNGQGGVGGQGETASSSSVGAGGEGAGTTSSSSSSSSSSSGGPKPEVFCGGMDCAGTTLCCIKPGNTPYYTCAEPFTCENAEIRCDGPEDCPIQFECCGKADVNGNFLKLHCAKECLPSESQICNTDKMPTTCPDPLGCSAIPGLGAPYGSCE